MVTIFQLVERLIKEGKKPDDVRRVLASGGWRAEVIEEALSRWGSRGKISKLIEMTDITNNDVKNRSIMISLVVVGLALIGILLAVAISKSAIPPADELSARAGFSVLLPRSLPHFYTPESYAIDEGTKIDSRGLILMIKGPNKTRIRVVEYHKPRDESLTLYVDKNYAEYQPREIYIVNHFGYLITKPPGKGDTQEAKLLMWDDEVRRFTLVFTPASLFSDGTALGIGASFYQ